MQKISAIVLPLLFVVVAFKNLQPTCAMAFPKPPWQKLKLDHVVVRCRNFNQMFDFYTKILGCTIDQPEDENIGRFGGALSHLRVGDAMIDLLSYDRNQLTEDGKAAIQKIHAGGAGLSGDVSTAGFSANTTTMDHFCLRCDQFDEGDILAFLKDRQVKIVDRGQRKGADGVGPSVYIEDPEGNIIELKGPPGQASIET